MYNYDDVFQAALTYFDNDDLAAKVWIDKFALRDKNDNLLEKTPVDMHKRLSKEFARIEKKKFKNPLSEEKIFKLFDKFKYIVPQGSPMFGIGNDYQITSLSNCYVLEEPLDSYSSILQIDEQLVNISKRRGGVGISLDNLRPRNTPTSNAAKSSTGIISWMERYSNSIREVGQNARRGALMLTLSVHHPDILDFCTIKNDPLKVTGANISVKLTKEFLKAVKNNTDYELRWPLNNPTITKKISAKEVWDVIIHSAWLRAEPGILMWDNILDGPADCYEDYRSISTNPCCFSINKEIFIKTKNGLKEIKSITNDDLIYITDVFTEKYSKNTGYINHGLHEVFDVVFDNKESIRITKNHNLILIGGYGEIFDWVPLSKCKIGDKICTEDGGFREIISIESKGLEEVGCIHGCGLMITEKGTIIGNSEIPLSELDSCRLMALNLLSYVENPFITESYFNYDKFYNDVQIAQRLMDDLIDLESEKIDKILEKIKSDPEPTYVKEKEIHMWEKIKKYNNEGRRTGLGITALGDTLAALNIKYGSNESIKVVNNIYCALKLGAYRSSVDMSKELGSFACWDHSKEKDCTFLNRFKDEDIQLWNDMQKYGRRNIALLTTAPTGSLSCLTQTTSGIEPLFMTGYTRRKKINPGDTHTRVDFTDPNGDKWQEFMVYHPTIKKWMDITGKNNIEESPWFGCCAEEIDWQKRVELQAVAQKHVCHAISSTINLPENVSEEEVANIYMTAFDLGCKGITVYRKNCRTGVLVDKKEQNNTTKDRPKELLCDVHHISVKGKHYLVLVGLNPNPYEIFSCLNGFIDKNIKTGKIIKNKRGYKAIFEDESELTPIMHTSSDEEAAITRLISCLLRAKVSIEEIVDQLEKTQGDMLNFSKSLSRTLRKYIRAGTKTGAKCPECEADLIYQEGCKHCSKCSYSQC